MSNERNDMIEITETTTTRGEWPHWDSERVEIKRSTYLVRRESDCRCGVAKEAYLLARQFGLTVKVGCVTASPVKEPAKEG